MAGLPKVIRLGLSSSPSAACLAALSTCSLPSTPTWEGVHLTLRVFPFRIGRQSLSFARVSAQ